MSRMGVALGQVKDTDVRSSMWNTVRLGGHWMSAGGEKCLQSAGDGQGYLLFAMISSSY